MGTGFGERIALVTGSQAFSPCLVHLYGGTSDQILSDGSTTISATARDTAGNTSTAGTRSVVIDTIANTPTLALATDSGSSNTDRITNSGVVNVTGLESGATWQYSTNNGLNWTNGAGTNFTLTGDGVKSVLVRQTDVAGNTSTSTPNPFTFTLDTAAPAAPNINGFKNASSGTLTITGMRFWWATLETIASVVALVMTLCWVVMAMISWSAAVVMIS